MPEKRPFRSTSANSAPASKSLLTSSVKSLPKTILSYTCSSQREVALQRSFRRSCVLHLTLIVRKFTSRHYTLDDLIARGTLTHQLTNFFSGADSGIGTGKTFPSSQLGRKGPPRGSPIWSCAIKRKPPSPRPRSRSEQPSFLLYMSSANPAAASFAKCSRLVEAGLLGPERRCGGAASEEACNRWSPRVLGRQGRHDRAFNFVPE
jgi:hypothetical protein